MQQSMIQLLHTLIYLFFITAYTFNCLMLILQFYNVQFYMSTRLSRLHFEKLRLCFSITCRRNCFCSSSFVIVELKFCIRATPRSALSFTQARLLTNSHAILYDWLSGHSSTGILRKTIVDGGSSEEASRNR